MKKKLFISSVTRGNKELRRSLADLSDDNVKVWVAEVENPELGKSEPLVIVDTLLDELAQSDCVLIILGNSDLIYGGQDHGQLIPVGRGISNVSYFEIELYQAALMNKPIHISVCDGFTPSARLEGLLRLVRPLLRSADWTLKNDTTIVGETRQFIKSLTCPDSFRSPKLDLVGFLTTLCKSDSNKLLFLDGEFDQSRMTLPDPEVIHNLLVQPAVNSPGFALTHDKKLARAWIAIRELMAVSYRESNDVGYLKLWNAALGKWSEPAAWYGLHGHILMGCLAAINSTGIVRQKLRSSTARKELDFAALQDVGGARGSALYSIAKRFPSWHPRRYRLLFQARTAINEMLQTEHTDTSGLKSVRASINMHLLLPHRAIQDYEEALALRRSARDGEGRIGESMVELGYAYVRSHYNRNRGLAMIRDGVDLLQTSGRTDFLIRAYHKLADAYKRVGKKDEADAAIAKALELAQAGRALDQSNQIRNR